MDDVFFIVHNLESTFLLLLAIRETDSELERDAKLKEPLLRKSKGSLYASTSWLMSELFELNWPKSNDRLQHPVQTALLCCFWKELLFTAFLAIVRLSIMYVGLTLIQKFVDFTSRKQSSPYERYYPIAILHFTKFIEGLLSCSARQEHGIGQIVSYMVVDAQQLSNMMAELRNLWLMPLQVGAAFALLFSFIGISVVVAFLGLLVLLVITIFGTKWNNHFQFNEEHFNKRIQAFREAEYGWLTKFMYSSPLLISSLTFGAAIVFGFLLDVGKVFTLTMLVRILQDPIKNFPQALIDLSQAMISLGRLDSYMVSRELIKGVLVRVESCNDNVVVKVKDRGIHVGRMVKVFGVKGRCHVIGRFWMDV
ncbi:hypothetical protein NE237_020342 [Protea cynaroides]|uniref:ABC transmembrane type-1 domain-containing protein n=1 Tax=Protea cynaroides TaxID=273540 RepID=A0A9Q0HAC2_9MAGN|nr:hypothetical protein NE237_020342 [Protea cynaroides]